MHQLVRALLVFVMLTSLAWAQGNPSNTGRASGVRSDTNGRSPNILYIIIDDAGIDQFRVFGYGGVDAPKTPNIDAIAHAGVRFRNVWSMPECSPSRAVFFEGRWPLRTNVNSALLSNDLANSQVSPFEITTPKLLRKRGYESANFGKFHLATDTNNPFGTGIVHALGWDYFDGFLDGAPHPIDTTAGGVVTVTQDGTVTAASNFTCGFVPNAIREGGADSGACRFLSGACKAMSATSDTPTPGRSCMEQGGLFVPNATCGQPPPPTLTFANQNAYYAWERVINEADGSVKVIDPASGDPSTRRYIGEVMTDAAVNWINGRKGNKKWMVTAAYPQIHAPYQQAPQSLTPGSADIGNLDCTPNIKGSQGLVNYHLLSNQMLESTDTEIGRLLVQTGLASYNADGSLDYQPEKTDTIVIIVGDNGTYAPGVKPPFEVTRAKGFVYQTGVWVPLIIAGPLVKAPGRQVDAMVNIADLYELFGEIGGVDVRKAVPPSHVLDSQPMLAYLTNPGQAEIRQTNFTQIASNIHPSIPPPCVVQVGPSPTCVQLFNLQQICEFEGGKWFGPNATPQFTSCCALKNANLPEYADGLNIVPDAQRAVRNDFYKMVEIEQPDCAAPPTNDVYPDVKLVEFYEIDQAPIRPKLDTAREALCADTLVNGVYTQNCPGALTNQLQRTNFKNLSDTLDAIMKSEVECPGDGNLDKVVDQLDVRNWTLFSKIDTSPSPSSSWYDFNHDGKTDADDLRTIQENLHKRCLAKN